MKKIYSKNSFSPLFGFFVSFLAGSVVMGVVGLLVYRFVFQPKFTTLQHEYEQLYDQYMSYMPPINPTPMPARNIEQDKGTSMGSYAEQFNKTITGFDSSLFSGVTVSAETISYRKKTMQAKFYSSDGFGFNETIYDSPTDSNEIPSDFATFFGYENYALYGTPVLQHKQAWKESYTTKKGLVMYYRYEYTPKSIGVVLLSVYLSPSQTAIHKPILLEVWYSKFTPGLTNDEIIRAKSEVQKIADTIELYM